MNPPSSTLAPDRSGAFFFPDRRYAGPMNSRTKSLLAAGPIAVFGLGFLVLAGLSVPVVGALIFGSVFLSASSPQLKGSPLTAVPGLLTIPVQLAYFGAVLLAVANKRLTKGVRVSNTPILLFSALTAAFTLAAIFVSSASVAYFAPIGLGFPLILAANRFFEKPSGDDTPLR